MNDIAGFGTAFVDPPKLCCICGAKALSCNFGRVTCESCKAFFRRNALRNDVIGSCDGTCVITKETRSVCKSCRLEKCFRLGMKKELILTTEQREERKRKIEENRQQKNKLQIIGKAIEEAQLLPSAFDKRIMSRREVRHKPEFETATIHKNAIQHAEDRCGVVPLTASEDARCARVMPLAASEDATCPHIMLPAVPDIGSNSAAIATDTDNASSPPPPLIDMTAPAPAMTSPYNFDRRLSSPPSEYVNAQTRPHYTSEFENFSEFHRNQNRDMAQLLKKRFPSHPVTPSVYEASTGSLQVAHDVSWSLLASNAVSAPGATYPPPFGLPSAEVEAPKFAHAHASMSSPTVASTTHSQQYAFTTQPQLHTSLSPSLTDASTSQAHLYTSLSPSLNDVSAAQSQVQMSLTSSELADSLYSTPASCMTSPAQHTQSTFSTADSIRATSSFKYAFDFATFVTPEVTSKMSPETALLLTELAESFAENFECEIEELNANKPSFNKVFSQTESSIKHFVRMVSRLSTFQSFGTHDQILLLKNSIIDMFILLSIRAYDVTSGDFYIRKADGSYQHMSVDSLKSLPAGMALLTSYQRFAVEALNCIRQDGTVIMCLIMLRFFGKASEQTTAVYQQVKRVEKCHQLYKETLGNYLRAKYSHTGAITLESVMDLSCKLTKICVKWQEALKVCTLDELSPLVVEICEIPGKK